MQNEVKQFQTAAAMPYANNDKIRSKAESLFIKLKEHLKSVKPEESLFFKDGETVYIPDLHGDFVHLIITLYRHGVLELDLNLKKDFKYVFLGDFYDRAPDADVIDFWLNTQIKNNLKIYRLVGNHEMAFLERNEKGYPVIFPSQDSIIDTSNNFQITENLLKNIGEGKLLAAYVDCGRDVACNVSTLYVHSYIMNDDFTELGLEHNTNILNFANALNKRFQQHGQDSYNVFLNCKKEGKYNWKEIIKPFIIPQRSPVPNAKVEAISGDIPATIQSAATKLARAKIEPTDKSIPPLIITKVRPIPRIALIELCSTIFKIFGTEKK